LKRNENGDNVEEGGSRRKSIFGDRRKSFFDDRRKSLFAKREKLTASSSVEEEEDVEGGRVRKLKTPWTPSTTSSRRRQSILMPQYMEDMAKHLESLAETKGEERRKSIFPESDTMDEEEEEKERKKFIHRRETRYV